MQKITQNNRIILFLQSVVTIFYKVVEAKNLYNDSPLLERVA